MTENSGRRQGEQREDEQSANRQPAFNLSSTEAVRNLLSIILFAGFVLTGLMALFLQSSGNSSENLLQNFGSVYSGVIGAVIGYYFGKGQG